LVENGKNGFVYEGGNLDKLKEKMEEIVYNKKLMREMGKESLKIVSKWNLVEDVKATVKALDYIYEDKGAKE